VASLIFFVGGRDNTAIFLEIIMPDVSVVRDNTASFEWGGLALARALASDVVALVLEALFAVLLCVDEVLDVDAGAVPLASGAERRHAAVSFGRLESLESGGDAGGGSDSFLEGGGFKRFNVLSDLFGLHGDGDGDEQFASAEATGNWVALSADLDADETGINAELCSDGFDQGSLLVLGERFFGFTSNSHLYVDGDSENCSSVNADCASLMAVSGSTGHVNGLRVEAADFVSVVVLLEEESLAVAAVVTLGLAVGRGVGVIVG